jgi:RNA recognition motif-containing protein
MNIYISNLSYNVNDGDLRELFEEYGQVSSAKVITDKFSGRSRGFGFVEMASDEEGKKAIEELNQAEFDGKVISVAVARPRTDDHGSAGGKRPFSGQRGGSGGFNQNRDRGPRRNY